MSRKKKTEYRPYRRLILAIYKCIIAVAFIGFAAGAVKSAFGCYGETAPAATGVPRTR